MARAAIVKPPSRRRCIAITGASTFLGRNLVGVFEEDDSVRRIVTIDVKRAPTAGLKTRAYDVDLTAAGADERIGELVAAEQIDTLIHLAFVPSPTYASAWAHELEAIGTMHVLDGLRQSEGVQRLLLASHTWLYGADPGNPNFVTESAALAADATDRFFADRIAAEREVNRYAEQKPDVAVAILRTAPIVGPTVNNFMTRYLSKPRLLSLLGFDPMWQFVHEIDAVAAFKIAADVGAAGTFNIVGDGVLPLSKVMRLAGRRALPIPHPLARATMATMWAAKVTPWPPSFAPYLRFVCVADGARAANVLGYHAACTSEDALLDYATAARLRDVRGSHEARA